jgi:hypothetical protein
MEAPIAGKGLFEARGGRLLVTYAELGGSEAI